ncbi:MAG: cupin domain-containing protein [Deltaproteobacteria bacterium]|nr:cupin domain-containing protein [Deltaproteobacteria bacterium]
MSHFADTLAAAQFAADKMKKNNLFTTERLFCDVYCFEPGQEQAPHAHAGSDKVYFVIEGSARIRVGEDERETPAGSAALAPAGLDHGIRNPGPGRLRVLVFMAPKP